MQFFSDKSGHMRPIFPHFSPLENVGKRVFKKNSRLCLKQAGNCSKTGKGTMEKKGRETVVDGYNFIHALYRPGRSASMQDLRALAEEILWAWRQSSRQHVTVVYDGGAAARETSSAGGSIEVVFSGRGTTADRWIIDHVRRLGARAGLVTVVSSDREIQRFATAWGAGWRSSESFIGECASMGLVDGGKRRAAKQQHPAEQLKAGRRSLSDEEVARWAELFAHKG